GGGKFGLFGKPMLEVTAAREVEGGGEGNGGLADPLAHNNRWSRLQALLKGRNPAEV
ncbi:MAG: hypothetical protein GWO16_02860, partial [Gammaproteobacteria bacterium]|nr:hypothetical protein [Gammaproteobacteria bacterium]NIT62762.1 hypothetical protein [Gammaproteobacteria bacterium]NIV19724.1 hypothetical protein [Gammaproteobacteria bacterium]NIY31342.1 hypothetical protein [Gammaproteobacteria bacterium]